MITQSHAHAKYESQDIKHRGVVNVLRQMHAGIPPDDSDDLLDDDLKALEARVRDDSKAGSSSEGMLEAIESARILGKHMFASFTPEPKDAVSLADAVTRYYNQAQAADAWEKTYDELTAADSDAGEGYDRSMLAAEVGIVVAAVALMLKRKVPFLAACALGVVCVALMAKTWVAQDKAVDAATAHVAAAEKAYNDLVAADKVSASESELAGEMRTWGVEKQKEWAKAEADAKAEEAAEAAKEKAKAAGAGSGSAAPSGGSVAPKAPAEPKKDPPRDLE
jgi:hypothetical protein